MNGHSLYLVGFLAVALLAFAIAIWRGVLTR